MEAFLKVANQLLEGVVGRDNVKNNAGVVPVPLVGGSTSEVESSY